MTPPPPGRRPSGPPRVDIRQVHRDWLALIDTSGPFLTLPVLTRTWGDGLVQISKDERERLRKEHAKWIDETAGGQHDWISYILRDLLGWDELLLIEDPAADQEPNPLLTSRAVPVPDHDAVITPSFLLARPGATADQPPALLGLVVEDTQSPLSRYRGESWSATPADRVAHLCRHHEVPLGLATNGRTFVLVYAPRGEVTTTAAFDTTTWNEATDIQVVRAFVSLLGRERFFAVPEPQRLPELLRRSAANQEEVTEQLGVQIRQAVELLVTAIGRADRARDLMAEDAYWGAVNVMMRLVFLLFAEERGLLPADNEIYSSAYAASTMYRQLDEQLISSSTAELEQSHTAWPRLIALFNAIHAGIEHPELSLPAYDGSIFNPNTYPWLARLAIDDLVVLNMLRSIQRVVIGKSKADREERELSFRALQVEQIGYVYEGLLSYEARRAVSVVVGLIGADGTEEEITLTDLEQLAAPHRQPDGTYDVPRLAAALAKAYAASGIGSESALTRKLTPLDETQVVETRRWLRSVLGTDTDLVERLLPFAGTIPERKDGTQDERDRGGIIRSDLKGHPVIFTDGALYVTESKLRGDSGTHYTPQSLAREVAAGALEPLVYSPGPLQTGEKKQWRLRPSKEILGLKVADIACGSGAFLVAACRYLADRYVEAKIEEQDPDYAPKQADVTAVETSTDAEADPITVKARRLIIEHCLYGADINAMAVEMAKLSLWLVSMDAHRPFTFLDDRLTSGDSLLGITSLEQLEWMHLDVAAGTSLHRDQRGTSGFDFTEGVRELAAEVVRKRRAITAIDGDTLEHVEQKRDLLKEAQSDIARAALFADLIAGAGIASRVKRDDIPWYRPEERREAQETKQTNLFLYAANHARRVAEDPQGLVTVGEERETVEHVASNQARQWLETEMPPGDFGRHPIHWPLVFTEVFIGEKPGFDAVIGNPPFLGSQKMTAALGEAYREYLVEDLAKGKRGQADLVAYFFLRAHQLITPSGQTGLIATNTLAQGDTREVGLDQIVANGTVIRQAIKSQKWGTSSASLENCVVWTSNAPLGETAILRLDGVKADGITTSLDPASGVVGVPQKLVENEDKSFIGSYVLGLGFTIATERAAELIAEDERYAEVLYPYVGGKDLNSRAGCDASRWVINFQDWDEDKARSYPVCYEQVRRLVKPERDKNNRSVYRERWWQYAERRPAMVQATVDLEAIVVIARVSDTLMPVIVDNNQVFSEKIVVFASDDFAFLALVSSAIHAAWVVSQATSLGAAGSVTYSPERVFETFPKPELAQGLRVLGRRLHHLRRAYMLPEGAGLTDTYNRVHDESDQSPKIAELREVHRLIDEATARAYGWDDLVEQEGGLGHGFHETAQGVRYTVSEAVRRVILDRLLEENLHRFAVEEAAGLHTPAAKAARRKARKQAVGGGKSTVRRAAKPSLTKRTPPKDDQEELTLF